jgi:hypothetical protein
MRAASTRERRGIPSRSERLRLTDRDRELLLALHEYRYLSLVQAERLLFPSAQTTARRIRRLERAGYVSTFAAPGVTGRFAALARSGAELVAHTFGAGLPDPRESRASLRRPQDYLFLRHFHMVTDLRIALKAACDRGGVQLLGFLPEYLASRNADGRLSKHIRGEAPGDERAGCRIAHVPDGVFALSRGTTGALFFLEADRGTEVIGDPRRGVLRMIAFYLALLKDGGFQRYQEEFACPEPFKGFRVLFVTTSKDRVQNIREAGARLAVGSEHAKRFIWLSTSERAASTGILGSIWKSLDPSDPAEYAIVREE